MSALLIPTQCRSGQQESVAEQRAPMTSLLRSNLPGRGRSRTLQCARLSRQGFDVLLEASWIPTDAADGAVVGHRLATPSTQGKGRCRDDPDAS